MVQLDAANTRRTAIEETSTCRPPILIRCDVQRRIQNCLVPAAIGPTPNWLSFSVETCSAFRMEPDASHPRTSSGRRSSFRIPPVWGCRFAKRNRLPSRERIRLRNQKFVNRYSPSKRTMGLPADPVGTTPPSSAFHSGNTAYDHRETIPETVRPRRQSWSRGQGKAENEFPGPTPILTHTPTIAHWARKQSLYIPACPRNRKGLGESS